MNASEENCPNFSLTASPYYSHFFVFPKGVFFKILGKDKSVTWDCDVPLELWDVVHLN